MYTDLLPQALNELSLFISQKESQLNEYRLKDKPSKQAIEIQQNQIFQLTNSLNIIKNSIIEFHNNKIEHGTKKYLQGLNEANNDYDTTRKVSKNTYSLGEVLNYWLEIMKTKKEIYERSK